MSTTYTSEDLLNMIYSKGFEKTIDYISAKSIEDADLSRRWESLQLDRLDWQDDISDFMDKLEETVDESEGAEE